MAEIDTPSRRRQLTYGKRSRLAQNSYDFNALNKPIIPKATSKIARPQLISVSSRKTDNFQPPPENPTVFDVPSSDEERPLPKPTAGRLRKPTKAQVHRDIIVDGFVEDKGGQQEEAVSPASSTTSRKRKRKTMAKITSTRDSTREDANESAPLKTKREGVQRSKSDGEVLVTSKLKGSQTEDRKSTSLVTTRETRRSKPSIPKFQEHESTSLPSTPLQVNMSPNDVVLGDSPSRSGHGVEISVQSVEDGTRSAILNLSTPTVQRSPGVRSSLTPQQSQIWNKLLDNGEDDQMPRVSPTSPALPKLKTSSNLQKPTRRRLIDTLLPSSENSRPIEEDEESYTSSEDLIKGDTPKRNAYSQQQADSNAVSQQSLLAGGARRTYANQRSFLQEQTTELEDLLNMPFDNPVSPVVQFRGRRDFAKPNALLPKTASLSDDEDGEESIGLKSIHELRAAGDSQRQDDEVNSLLEDINDGQHSMLSIRRSAGFDLAQKLLDSGFCDRFVHDGHVRRAFLSSRIIEDPILGTAMLSAMICILGAANSRHISTFMLEAGVMDLIARMLSYEKDLVAVAKDRGANMSKAGQASVKDFKELISQSSWWKSIDSVILSPRLIALKALDELMGKSREIGNMDDILGSKILGTILEVLSDIRLQLSKTNTSVTVSFLSLALSILESYTISPTCALDRSIWTSPYLRHLVIELDNILKLEDDSCAAKDCLALRICLNLANNSKRNSEVFGKPSLISRLMQVISSGLDSVSDVEVENDEPRRFDRLVLSLGALINLAEWSERVRLTILEKERDQLQTLLKAFVERRKVISSVDSLSGSHANVAYGYLAVLLGNLCSSDQIRKEIQSRLPDDRIEVLIEAVEEFIAHHKVVDRREQGTEVWTAFTDRLQSVADNLKRVI